MQIEDKAVLTTWVGIDVAKETFDAAIYLPVEFGQTPRSIMDLPKESFPRSLAGVKAFNTWSYIIRDKAGLDGGNMRIVMEATGRYSLELHRWLSKELPFTCPAIEDPKTINNFIKSLKVRNKTDQIDAAAIARYGTERMPEPFHELPEDYQYLRELSRQRLATTVQLVAAKTRLLELTKFKELIKIQKGVVKSLEAAIEKLEKEMKNCIKNSPDLRESMEYAMSVPGIGFISAVTILAECGPLYMHKSRQLGAYSGLSPQIRNSGTSVRGSRISRQGPKDLRRVLYMASISATASNPRMMALHKRLVEKGKKPLQARCAVMRKLLILVRAVVVNRTRYSEKYLENSILNA